MTRPLTARQKFMAASRRSLALTGIGPVPAPGGRIVIAHVMPFDLTLGGPQRMLADWCNHAGPQWDIHILTISQAMSQFHFGDADVLHLPHQREMAQHLSSLRPRVVVLHDPGPDTAALVPVSATPVWVIHTEEPLLAAPGPSWGPQPSVVLGNWFPQDLLPAPWQGIACKALPLGVDLERYAPRPHPDPSNSPLIAGIVGRLSPEKVPLSFAKALAKGLPAGWHVHFIGDADTDHGHKLRDIFLDNPGVCFCGPADPRMMPEVYSSLDALLIPSTTETGSYALVEAMGCALPVVARRVGGLPFQAGSGAVFRDTDAGLLDTLGTLCNPQLRAECSIRARAEAMERHALHDQLRMHDEAYRHAAMTSAIPFPQGFVQHPRAPSTLLQVHNRPAVLPVPTGAPVILHVMPWELTVGGGQRMLSDWCRFSGQAWDVHIVTAGPAESPFAFSGAAIHQAGGPHQLAELAARLKPDVTVVHNVDHPLAVAAPFPQVWFAHGERILAESCPYPDAPVACIANYPQEPHESWQGIPTYTVRLGVDRQSFKPAPTTTRYPPSTLVAGIVGRLSIEKIPPDFLQALRSWDPGPWRLRFIGVGIANPYQRTVRQYLAGLPFVEFIGDIRPDQMPAQYQALDAVMVPSATETGSYAIVEAMASGVPVICRNLPGPRFTSGGEAIWVDDAQGLLDQLRKLDDEEERLERSDRALQASYKYHDVNRQTARVTAIYASAAVPRVSVLMPVYNTEWGMLQAAVNTVRAQTEPLWELILIDDGSDNERTRTELTLLAGSDPRIRLHTLGHRGISAALNYGLSVCRADLVARMDSDDLMYPTRLAMQLAYMHAHPRVDILGAQIDYLGQAGASQHPAVVDAALVAKTDWLLNHPTVMYRRHVICAMGGGYDETMTCTEDMDLWLRMIRARKVIRNLPDVLCTYRLHLGQTIRTHDTQEISVGLRDKYGFPQLPCNDLPAVFDNIYTKGLWSGGKPMDSGAGSSDEATRAVVDQLPSLLKRFSIDAVLDCGCGTAPWVFAALEAYCTRYLGIDVARSVIDFHRQHASDDLPNWKYLQHDLSAMPLHREDLGIPQARNAMTICRDVLIHLPFHRGLTLLRNARKVSHLLLATHWPQVQNSDIHAGQFRPTNLEAWPYRLPKPIELISEVVTGKYLALFNLDQWADDECKRDVPATQSTGVGIKKEV